ncbi:hypothetical protein F0562_026403 [Nyssa sinensis]|uniref:Uncharacterized protein n=1 Tax=Nyssa sinensis TaxID=561372 RepID=A0A5J5BEX4_9ASTE|nr:hypothetical protein F0562_026403 [Nyssa sinensis]
MFQGPATSCVSSYFSLTAVGSPAEPIIKGGPHSPPLPVPEGRSATWQLTAGNDVFCRVVYSCRDFASKKRFSPISSSLFLAR